jgi:hypothetical protein
MTSSLLSTYQIQNLSHDTHRPLLRRVRLVIMIFCAISLNAARWTLRSCPILDGILCYTYTTIAEVRALVHPQESTH